MLFKKTASKKTQLDGWASRLDIEQGARKHQEQKEIDNGGVALAATVTEEVPPALSFQPVMDWTSAIGRQLYNSVAPASSASKEITEEANVVASNDVRTMTTKWTDSAPRYVVYGDKFLRLNTLGVPDPKRLKGGITYYNIAFWTNQHGASDNAKDWSRGDYDQKAAIVQSYNDAGVRLGLALFGATDKPLSDGGDPNDIAKRVAQFVWDNALQGVDIDFEEYQYFENDKKSGANFVIQLTKALRKLLPASRYYITHAPIAPLFDSKSYKYGYSWVEQQVGSLIDYYNVQFYNQGGDYVTKKTLIVESGKTPNTAVLQLHNVCKIPWAKIVVGKPLHKYDADNGDGYVDPSDLAKWLQTAADAGWNGGCMWWEYRYDELSSTLKVVAGRIKYKN